MRELMRGAGELVGETFGRTLKDKLAKKIEENFEINVSGTENLDALKDKPYVLVANHIKPKDSAAQMTGVSPDAFMIAKAVFDATGQELKIVSKSDDGWSSEGIYKYVQKYITQPAGKGLHEGMGTIPISKNPGSFNRDFLKIVKEEIEKNNPILIFPEGDWNDDFDVNKEGNIESGAAHIAQKHNIPLVPAYIRGAHSWKDTEEITRIAFGPSFEVAGDDTKEDIGNRIRESIGELQKQVVERVEGEYLDNKEN